jgi:hypothetical protein
MNFLNRDVYRKWQIISSEFRRIRDVLLRTRISLLNGRISLLQRLAKLADHLVSHPRYVYINVHHATIPRPLLEVQSLQEVMARYHGYKQLLLCLESQLEILKNPFENREESTDFVRGLIDNSIKKLDPETGYLPETDTYGLLAEFLLSPASPYKLRTKRILAKGDFLTVHEQLVRSISAYVGLLAGHLRHVQVLNQMCARFLFDQCVFPAERAPSSGKLEKYIRRRGEETVGELALGESIIRDELVDRKAIEVLAEQPILAECAKRLLLCHFLGNPIDLLFNIREIQGQLSTAIAAERGKDQSEVKDFDALFAVWKLLFIVAQVPDPERIIDFVEMWKKLDFIPSGFLSAYKVPRLVVKALLEEAIRV